MARLQELKLLLVKAIQENGDSNADLKEVIEECICINWMLPYGRRPTRADLEDSCKEICKVDFETIVEQLGPLVLPSRIGTIQIKKDLSGSRTVREITAVQQAQGYDDATEQFVFIKFERSDSGRMLQNEINIFEYVREKNVCGIPRYITEGSNGSWDFLVLGFLEGQNLRQLKAQITKTQDILLFGLQISKILAEIHNAGVVHCDVAPQNIFVLSEQNLKVLQIRQPHYAIVDFGNARLLDVEMGTGGGTRGFQSPEQLDEHPLDCRSDVFSFGVVLGWLLTGVDFTDERKFRDAVRSSDCDPAVRSIIARSTLTKRDSRFSDMGAVHRAFDELCNRTESRKHRRRAQLICCTFVVFIFVGSALAWKVRSLSEQKRRDDARAQMLINRTDALAERYGADELFQSARMVRETLGFDSTVITPDLYQVLSSQNSEGIRARLSPDLVVPSILEWQAWKLNRSAATYVEDSEYTQAANKFARAAEVADSLAKRRLNTLNAIASYSAAGKPLLAISLVTRELSRGIVDTFAGKEYRFELYLTLSSIHFNIQQHEEAGKTFANAEAILNELITSHDKTNTVNVDFAKAALLSLRFRFASAEGDTKTSEQTLSELLEIREKFTHIQPGEAGFYRVLAVDLRLSIMYAILEKIRALAAHTRHVVRTIQGANTQLPDDLVAVETARHKCIYVLSAYEAQYREGMTDAFAMEVEECASSILQMHRHTSYSLHFEVQSLLLYGVVLERHPSQPSKLLDLIKSCKNRREQLRKSTEISMVTTGRGNGLSDFAVLEIGSSRISVMDEYLSILPVLREAAIKSILVQNVDPTPETKRILAEGAGHDRFDSERIGEIIFYACILRKFKSAQRLGESWHRSVKLALRVAPNCAAHEIYDHMFTMLVKKLFVAGDEDRIIPGRHDDAISLWSAFMFSLKESWFDEEIRSDVRTNAALLETIIVKSANNFAWVAALNPDSTETQLITALGLAKQCCRYTKYSNVNALETLAYCQRRVGHANDARQTFESIEQLQKESGK
ncbi:protein kinase [Roseiconus lacunae]|uniref:protein kinase domain-containing protein n=1 Tax=Roseiconus lacunae TaxID=2605694 RepID=UPI0030916430|nr:protein kinase [Stieleria sp. HD01]